MSADEIPREDAPDEMQPLASDPKPSLKREEVLGAKGRRALLAKLPPLSFSGGQILDSMQLGSEDDLAKILDLKADDFLDPLWERVHGRST